MVVVYYIIQQKGSLPLLPRWGGVAGVGREETSLMKSQKRLDGFMLSLSNSSELHRPLRLSLSGTISLAHFPIIVYTSLLLSGDVRVLPTAVVSWPLDRYKMQPTGTECRQAATINAAF